MINIDIKWQEVSIAERKEVVEMYNKYYNTEEEPLSFEYCDQYWTDCRWISIKYTFGIKPIF